MTYRHLDSSTTEQPDIRTIHKAMRVSGVASVEEGVHILRTPDSGVLRQEFLKKTCKGTLSMGRLRNEKKPARQNATAMGRGEFLEVLYAAEEAVEDLLINATFTL